MSGQNKKRLRKWANHISTSIFIVVLIAVMLVVISAKASGGEPKIFGYQLKTVLSGSMEPGIQTGSLIAVKSVNDKTNFKKGDVITFHRDDILITHRIVEVLNNNKSIRYKTKGDNNDAPDPNPVPSQKVVGEYTGFTLPYAGYMITFSQSKNGALLLLIPGILLLCYSGMTLKRALSQLDSKAANDEKA